MPGRSVSPKGAFSAFGTAKNFMSVMKEMSFDEERRQAERMPRILVIAPDPATGRRIGDELTGTADSLAVTVWSLEAANRNIDEYDVVVIYDPEYNETYRRVRERSGMAALKVFDLASTVDPTWATMLRERVTSAVPDRAPAFGRWFPVFRPAASKAVIEETARVNAQFALMSNLPAAIPIVGSLAAAGADFFVLTKNQVMMVYKLAAINGRDMSDQWTIMREMIPVVGAGFLWRTLAREAADFVPFMLGAVPKIAIAYTGTVAAGRGADLYFKFGKKPTREQMQGFYAQAAESFKKLPLRTIGGSAESNEPPALHEVK
jgi:uncharacterized protein (DUF697 family)